VSDIEIGRAKRARRAYSFDDVAVVPSRRTRDTDAVSLGWSIDASKFDIPVLAAPTAFLQQAARHEWACFAAHQAVEKALKGLNLALGQQAWGHTLTRLWSVLPLWVRLWSVLPL
jgi:isopentenyl diphosphate isomerase/L-lactate dehydrogenase-like FMN-dependent dehydrogenase